MSSRIWTLLFGIMSYWIVCIYICIYFISYIFYFDILNLIYFSPQYNRLFFLQLLTFSNLLHFLKYLVTYLSISTTFFIDIPAWNSQKNKYISFKFHSVLAQCFNCQWVYPNLNARFVSFELIYSTGMPPLRFPGRHGIFPNLLRNFSI